MYKPRIYDKKCDLTSNDKRIWGKLKHFLGKIVFIWFWAPGDWHTDITSEMFSTIYFYFISFFTISFVRLIFVIRTSVKKSAVFMSGNVYTYQTRDARVWFAWLGVRILVSNNPLNKLFINLQTFLDFIFGVRRTPIKIKYSGVKT